MFTEVYAEFLAMLQQIDLLLGLTLAFLGVFLAQDKLRASTRLSLVLDVIDNGSVRFASWRASADIRTEIRSITELADRAILWLSTILFLAIRFELRSIMIGTGILVALAAVVSGSLTITFSHQKFLIDFAKFWGIGLIGLLFLTLGNPERQDGSVLISSVLLSPLGIYARSSSEVAGYVIAFFGLTGLFLYLVMSAVGSAVGYGVFLTLAGSRRLGRWAGGVTKPKFIAGIVLFSFGLTVIRVLIAYFK